MKFSISDFHLQVTNFLTNFRVCMAWPSKDRYLTWKRVELKKYFLVSKANKSVPPERINDSIPVLILFHYKESISVIGWTKQRKRALAEISKKSQKWVILLSSVARLQISWSRIIFAELPKSGSKKIFHTIFDKNQVDVGIMKMMK